MPFLFIFILLRLKTLALFNTGSLFCYLLCYLINRRGRHNMAQALISAGMVAHAAITVVFLGRQSGFYVYIIVSVILTCLSPRRGWLLKGLIVLGFSFVYIGLGLYGEFFPPLAVIGPALLKAFFYGNSVAMLFITAMLVHYYRLTAQLAEGQLRQANHQLELLADTDPLTRLLNRRGMTKIIQNEVGRAGETARQFTVLFADIDDFKLNIFKPFCAS